MLKAFFEPFLAEQNRWFLWAPVFLGFGIVLYFSLNEEPSLWPATGAALFFTLAGILLRHSLFLPMAVAGLLVTAGFGAAQFEAHMLRQPMLQEKKEKQTILGRVMVINHLPDGFRLWLTDVQAENLSQKETPRTVRIKFRYQEKIPKAGDWISVPAMLYPLSKPAETDAFDFRRYAYFHGYGATGFAAGGWRLAEGPKPTWRQATVLFFERIRSRINAALLGDNKSTESAIAAALISGDQSGIDAGALSVMRASGISHILSVSGLHIALVAGIVFFTLRALLALVPLLALSWPIKKIAAFFALGAALFYTFMCAAPVPAVRAMVMSGVILIAVLFDRRALSMRLIAFAALITLLFAPSALLDPSFQLSFGAVMALIAVYEKNEHALWERFQGKGLVGKAWYYLVGSIITSVVATLATAPIILFTFQQVTWYGVLTNLIAVPLSSFIIMPAGIMAVLAIPFGLEEWPLSIMKEGIAWMVAAARFVAALPGAVTTHPALPAIAMPLIAVGGLWLCLWQKRWRFLGVIPLLWGTLSFLVTPRPAILVADDGLTLAINMDDGKRAIRAENKEDFIIKTWLQRDGLGPDGWRETHNILDMAEKGGEGPLSCAGYNCIYTRGAVRVGLPMTKESAHDMCGKVELIVTPFEGTQCDSSKVLWSKGNAQAIWIDGQDVKTIGTRTEKRLWN